MGSERLRAVGLRGHSAVMAVRVGAVNHLLRDKLAFAQEKEPLDVGLFLRTHSSWLLTNKQCS